MRDPRKDPQPGDILRRQGELRRVIAIEGNMVRCEWEISRKGAKQLRYGKTMYGVSLPYLSQWRRWAASAEVVDAPIFEGASNEVGDVRIA